MGGIFFGADADGMAGVGATAVADDDIGAFREEIDDFAFAFIAPLEADDAGVLFLQWDHNE
jgi:hypothetical protein